MMKALNVLNRRQGWIIAILVLFGLIITSCLPQPAHAVSNTPVKAKVGTNVPANVLPLVVSKPVRPVMYPVIIKAVCESNPKNRKRCEKKL